MSNSTSPAHDQVILAPTLAEELENAEEMYHELCAIDAKRHDPCVRDIFAAVVSHAEGRPARPWWEFTPERKARDAAREKARGEEAR